MLRKILGSKGNMSQAFIEGRRVCVTRVNAGPCVVTQVKNPEKEGYWAIQIGYGDRKLKNVTKPLQGHLKNVKTEKNAPAFLQEVRFFSEPKNSKGETFKVGDIVLQSEIFKKGDIVNISGISKGKGFAGVVKRWKFAGGPKTHGQSDRQRAPGSISGGTTPGRVRKGKKMAGRMGGTRITVKNLQIVDIDNEKGIITVSGQIPGVYGGHLLINKVKEGKLEGISEVQQQIVEDTSPATEEKKEETNVSDKQPAKEGEAN